MPPRKWIVFSTPGLLRLCLQLIRRRPDRFLARMSGISSESGSDAGSVKGKHIDEEEWGDDVSILSRYEGSSPAVIIFKFFLALLLIGACSGALVYSIINSEDEAKKEEVAYQPPEYFPVNNSQECPMGILTMVYRITGDHGATTGYMYENMTINWYQDNEKKKIYHRVGVDDKSWQYTYYVFETVTFYYNKTGCQQINLGYAGFLDELGLAYVRKLKTEEIMLQGEYQETAVYEGEPPTTVQLDGEHPSLIRGYASMTQPIIYGWEQYFAHTTSSNYSLYKQEYFFPEMAKMVDFSIFEDLPPECMT